MVRKWVLVFLGCFFAASAANAGNCRGKACYYATFGEDAKGCLEIRNSGREDIEVMVYTTGSVPTTVRIAGGSTERVFKTGRVCILATQYLRSEAQFIGGVLAPSR